MLKQLNLVQHINWIIIQVVLHLKLIHSNDYWKVYKSTSKGLDEVLGRIGHWEFKNYDRIQDSPVYINGMLMNGK